MIEIINNRIYFYNKNKPEITTLDFECISGYVCPECKNILLAYFVGHIESAAISERTENDRMAYAYDIGHSNGATWMALKAHTHKEVCKWRYMVERGVGNGLKSFLKWHDGSVKDEKNIVETIKNGLEGYKIVRDEIGRDEPILLVNDNVAVSIFKG